MVLQLVSFYGICVFLDYVWANELIYGSLNFVYVFCGENMYIYFIASHLQNYILSVILLSILKKLIIPICYRWPDWLRVCAAQDKTRLLHRAGSAGQGQSRDTQRYSHSALSGTAAYSSIEQGQQDRYSPELLSGTATPLSQVQQLTPP